MTDKQQKLIDILKEMFQLDQSDLDFGIYRIMNAKADEIRVFLEKDLVGSIKDAFSASGSNPLQAELDEAIASARSLGVDPETIPKVQELRAKLSGTTESTALENDVYSHLATFFSRYYKDGDFVSLRRYKKDIYAIPYEGEEVKLHWANSDQYYIKTSEYFKDYTFKVSTGSGLIEGEEKKIHFKLIDADTETNNNKASSDKERRFVLHEANPAEEIDGELYIYFEYKSIGKERQDKLNEKAVERIFALEKIKEWLPILQIKAPTEKNKNRTLLEKHINSYTSRNSFDYFIHKDLGGFLSRELDFYIKNEMLYLDDIEDASTVKIEESLSKIKTFKSIVKKIIAFLTQLEEFQKSLWLKKKFIIETNYCITLDKIDEKYYEKIFANEAQLTEWRKLFGDEALASFSGTKVPPPEEVKYLVLDTKFFDANFKSRLLAEFDDLDEEIDGVLINSENFGALNLLQERHKEKIETIYIDPPYNAKSSEILYKNTYKHSSFLSFIYDRISYGHSLLSEVGITNVAIDDYEIDSVKFSLNNIFGAENRLGSCTVTHNPGGRQDDKFFPTSHEYLLVYGKDNTKCEVGYLELSETKIKEYRHTDEYGKFKLREYRRSGANSRRTERPNLWYPIYVNPETLECSVNPFEKSIVVYPIDNHGIERCWRWNPNTFEKKKDKYIYVSKRNNSFQFQVKERMNDNLGERAKTTWNKTEYASVNGTTKLKNLFGNTSGTVFSFPKSPYLVKDAVLITSKNNSIILDFFAGSGTTGEAVINLNRELGSKRKYILVEMGEYFDTATKPRIQKVIYTDNWKDGKPQDKEGISQMFKYFKLESYEDTLNNLEFRRTKAQQTTIESNPKLKEDYLLNYMLDYESSVSQLNIDNFSKPFDYKLKVSTGSVGETKESAIDLVETFNYLIGLKVKTRAFIKEFLVIEGENLKEEKILIIWREGNDNEALNSFFSKMDFSVYDREFDTIYVNGDNNLANLKKDEDHFKVKLIEEEFKNRMFGE